MKTPEEIKAWLGENSRFVFETVKKWAALEYIQQLESTYSQVSKDLCGNENATLDELLKAADQLKNRLAQVERERDAAVHDLYANDKCIVCKQELFGDGSYIQNACFNCVKWCNFKWRGVCEENTKEV